jgi:fructokinase
VPPAAGFVAVVVAPTTVSAGADASAWVATGARRLVVTTSSTRPLRLSAGAAGGYAVPMYVGVDLGGTKIEGVVLDDVLAVVDRRRVPTERERGYDHIVGRVVDLVETLLPAAPGARAIGIGTPGALSSRTGRLKNSNTTCLNGRPLADDLQRRLPLPVVLENDANCFALAEARAGAGQEGRLVFGVILGTGVGGGIVIDGRVWSGPQHIAGEWGHHVLDPGGPPCYCGARGCVETFLAGPALEAAYRAAGGGAVDAAEIGRRVVAGDAVAERVVSAYLGRFGRALANVVDILDPDVIVLGGGVSNLDALYTAGRDAVAACVFNDELRTPIVRNTLGDSAGVIGAALLGAGVGPSAG